VLKAHAVEAAATRSTIGLQKGSICDQRSAVLVLRTTTSAAALTQNTIGSTAGLLVDSTTQ
jgi:hypothetical protein